MEETQHSKSLPGIKFTYRTWFWSLSLSLVERMCISYSKVAYILYFRYQTQPVLPWFRNNRPCTICPFCRSAQKNRTNMRLSILASTILQVPPWVERLHLLIMIEKVEWRWVIINISCWRLEQVLNWFSFSTFVAELLLPIDSGVALGETPWQWQPERGWEG